MCPKAIASLLYAILAYERFHRNALLMNSKGNLYYKNQMVNLAGMFIDDITFSCLLLIYIFF